MAETSAGAGYTLNTVSVSEAVQNSTNNIRQGGMTFGNDSEGFTTEQMVIAAVAVVILMLILRPGK